MQVVEHRFRAAADNGIRQQVARVIHLCSQFRSKHVNNPKGGHGLHFGCVIGSCCGRDENRKTIDFGQKQTMDSASNSTGLHPELTPEALQPTPEITRDPLRV
jgi:hypothetical protein